MNFLTLKADIIDTIESFIYLSFNHIKLKTKQSSQAV